MVRMVRRCWTAGRPGVSCPGVLLHLPGFVEPSGSHSLFKVSIAVNPYPKDGSMKKFRDLRLSHKILLGIVPFFVISMFLSVVLNNRFQRSQMLEQALASAQTYAQIIRESLVNMMINRLEVDESFLERMNTLDEIDSLRLVLNDLRLKPLLMTVDRTERIAKKRDEYRIVDGMEREVIFSGTPMWEREGDSFRAIIPFKADTRCQQCHQVEEGYVLAAANIYISLTRISDAIDTHGERTFWTFAGSAVLAIAIGALIFRRFVGQPVSALMRATEEIARGNLAESLIDDGKPCCDEIGRLASSFDAMRLALKANIGQLEELNAKLAVKNRQLQESLDALRKAEQELIESERLATVGQMASSIIHDFKNPMSVIYTYIQVLKNGRRRDRKLRERAYESIMKSVQRMLDMTQELLDFSRGEMRLDRATCRSDDFIADVVESVRMNLEKNKIALVIDQQYHGPFVIDVDRMRRALINIINNAQEAMHDGGTLTIRTRREEAGIAIEIADTGVGIPDELKEKIFQPFVTHGKSKGTGLGLAITKRVVDEHGGSISVESEQGKGTTFVVVLPPVEAAGHPAPDDKGIHPLHVAARN